MVLVDSSVWIDHLHRPIHGLRQLLADDSVLSHPFVTGEIAMGSLRDRSRVLRLLQRLPEARVARDEEVLRMIEAHTLYGLGVGYIDAHLVAAARLTPHTKVWTRDRRLSLVTQTLGLDYVSEP